MTPQEATELLRLSAHATPEARAQSYESMRLVYEVRSQLNEWSEQQKEADQAAADANADKRKLDAVPGK